jgi:polar amino acid transport system substrate-binding protein
MKIFGIIILLITFFSASIQAEVISLRADEWCPYNCTPGAEMPGYMIEIAQAVFGNAGHTIDYQILNWSRAILETRAGRHTAIVGAAKGDTPDFIFPAEPLGVAQVVFWVKKGNAWRYQGLESLAQIKIGVIQDYDYGEELNAYIAAHKKDALQVQILSGLDALELNIKKLALGRVDAVLEDQNVFQMKAHALGMMDLFENVGPGVETSFEENAVYIAFSPTQPKAQEYAQFLSEGVQTLRASGELQKVLTKYGLVDWQTNRMP